MEASVTVQAQNVYAWNDIQVISSWCVMSSIAIVCGLSAQRLGIGIRELVYFVNTSGTCSRARSGQALKVRRLSYTIPPPMTTQRPIFSVNFICCSRPMMRIGYNASVRSAKDPMPDNAQLDSRSSHGHIFAYSLAKSRSCAKQSAPQQALVRGQVLRNERYP